MVPKQTIHQTIKERAPKIPRKPPEREICLELHIKACKAKRI